LLEVEGFLLVVAVSSGRVALIVCIAQLSTAYSCQSPGTPLSRWAPRSRNRIPEPATRSATVRETSTSPGWAAAATRAPICTAIPAMSSPLISTSPVCRPTRISIPRARIASRIAHAQLIARAGPAKAAKKPSPVVATSRPPKRSSSARKST
jgi:hypothetical protein